VHDLPDTVTAPTGFPVTVIIPAYNEEDGLESVVSEIRKHLENQADAGGLEIIVIDDGSTDATAAAAGRLDVRVVTHPINLGYGASIKTGLRAARNDVILLTDADATYPAEFIPRILRELSECNMVVGARKGARVHIPTVRKPAKWLLNTVAEYLVQRPIPDLNSGLRAFRKADAMRFINLYPSGFSFTTTITLAYLSSDLLVRYVDINYNERVGKSKIRPLRDTKNLFLTVIRCILFFNPLRVCLPVSGALFLASMMVLFFVKDKHGNVLDGTVLALFFGGLQVAVTGFMADIMARMR
jgi:glycosyltransferase involved in cell wall biosynthesis